MITMVMNLESLLDVDVPVFIGLDDKFIHLLITFDGMRDMSSTKSDYICFLFNILFIHYTFYPYEFYVENFG